MNDIVVKDNTELSVDADFLDMIGESGELGYSEKSDDSLIPILGILQDNSGEVKKKHERYIEGAEPGDMIIRSLQRVYKGEGDEDTLLFQPCAFQHMWVEWNGEPGEGAPVGQYPFDDMPEDAKEVPDPQNPDRKIWRLDNGNRLVDTRYHYGHIVDGRDIIPAVIPMSGTNHTVSRQWTTEMKQHMIPGRNQKAPAFFRLYALRTSFIQRGAQSWFKYKISDRGFIGDEQILRAGFNLTMSVKEEKVTADVASDAPDSDVVEGSSNKGDDIPI